MRNARCREGLLIRQFFHGNVADPPDTSLPIDTPPWPVFHIAVAYDQVAARDV